MFSTSPLGFGGSQDFASQLNSQSPEKKARQEDKQTCVPATCRLLLDSVNQSADKNEVLLHGQEVANVVLVGTVEELSQGAVVEFTLNDGSGRIKVRHYQNNEGLEGIVAGRYVSVVGVLRPSPSLHISAMSLRPVTSADEISYHTIEVAHVALTLLRGGSRPPAPSPMPTSQPAASQLPKPAAVEHSQDVVHTPAPAPQASPAGGAKNLKESVLEVLRREQSRAEGVPLPVVCEQVKGSAASEVKAILDALVADGEAFNTIDDEHFQLL
jgi:hypothetical protein